jgi:hypothetical protein
MAREVGAEGSKENFEKAFKKIAKEEVREAEALGRLILARLFCRLFDALR